MALHIPGLYFIQAIRAQNSILGNLQILYMHSLSYTILYKGLDHPTKLSIQGGSWNHVVTSKLWENQKLYADFGYTGIVTSNLLHCSKVSCIFSLCHIKGAYYKHFLSLLILTFITFMTETILGFLHYNSFFPFHSVLLGRKCSPHFKEWGIISSRSIGWDICINSFKFFCNKIDLFPPFICWLNHVVTHFYLSES